MDSKDFVAAIECNVRSAAIEDTIANLKEPPGRRVLPEVRARSDWYNGLSEESAAYVNSAIATAVHAAIFGVLAALDGARKIVDGEGHFELTYVADERVLLNPQSINLYELLRPADLPPPRRASP